MSSATVENGSVAPGDTNEHAVMGSPLSQAILVKAPSTNTKDILLGKKGSPTFPLSPGESITLDLKGAALWYKNETSTDKLHWIAVSP